MAEEFVRFYALFYVSYRAFQPAINVVYFVPYDCGYMDHPSNGNERTRRKRVVVSNYYWLTCVCVYNRSLLCVTGEPHKSY